MNEDKRRYQDPSGCGLISPHNSLEVSQELEHLSEHYATSSRKELFNSFWSYSSKFKISNNKNNSNILFSCLKVPLTDSKMEDIIQSDHCKNLCFIMSNNEGEYKTSGLYASLNDLESWSAKIEKESIRWYNTNKTLQHFNELFPCNTLLNKRELTDSLWFKLNIDSNFLLYDLNRLLDQILLKLSGHLYLRKYNIHRQLNDHNLCKSFTGIPNNVDINFKEFENIAFLRHFNKYYFNRSQDGMELFKIIMYIESNLLEFNVLTNSKWFNTRKSQSENRLTVDTTSEQDEGNTKLDDEELSSLVELPFNSLLKYPFYLIHINCKNKFEDSSGIDNCSKTRLSAYSATHVGDSLDQNTNRRTSIVVMNDFQELHSILMADPHSNQIDCKQRKTLNCHSVNIIRCCCFSYCSQIYYTWLKSYSTPQHITKESISTEICLTKYLHCLSFGKRDRASVDRNLFKSGDNNNNSNNNNNNNEDDKTNRSKTLPDIIYRNGMQSKFDKIFQHNYMQKSCTGRMLAQPKPDMHHLCQWNTCMHTQYAVKTTEAVMHSFKNPIQMKDPHQLLFFEDEAVKRTTSEFAKKKTYAEDNMLNVDHQLRDPLQPDEKFSPKDLGGEENKAMHIGTVSKTDDAVIEVKSKEKISTKEDKKRMTADSILLDKTKPDKVRLASETDALQKKDGKKLRSREFDQAELHESHYTDTQLRAASGFGVQIRIGEETGESVTSHKQTSSPEYLTQVTSEGLSDYWEKSADHLTQPHDHLSHEANAKYKSASGVEDEPKGTHDISGKKATASDRYDEKSPQPKKTLASDNLSENSLQGTIGRAEKTSLATAAAYEKSKAHEAFKDLPYETKHEKTAVGSLNDLENSFSEFLKLTEGFDKSHTVLQSDDIQGYSKYLDYQAAEQISRTYSITDRKDAGRLSLDKNYSVEESSKLHTSDQLKKVSMLDSLFDDRREIMTEHLEYDRKQLTGRRQFETIEPLNNTVGIFEFLPTNAYELTPNVIDSLAFDISMIEGIHQSTALQIIKDMKKYDAKDFNKIDTTKFYELQQDAYSSSHMKQNEDMPSRLLLLSDEHAEECFSDTDLLDNRRKQAKSTKPKRHTLQHPGVHRKRPERRLIYPHKIPLHLDVQTRAHLRRKIKHCRKKIIAKHLNLYKRQQKLLPNRFDCQYFALNNEKNKELVKEIEEIQKEVDDSSQKLRENYITSPYNPDYTSKEVSKSDGLTPERLASLGCFILPNSINQSVNPLWYDVISRHQMMEPYQSINPFIKFTGGQYCQPLRSEQIHANFLRNSTNLQEFFPFTKPKSLTQLNNKDEKSLSLSEDKSLSSGSIRRRRRCSSTSSDRRMLINTNHHHQIDHGQYGVRSLNNCALLSSKDYLRSLLSFKKATQRKLNNPRRHTITTTSATKHLHVLRPNVEFNSLENLYTLKAKIYSLIDYEESVQPCSVDAVTFTEERQQINPVLEKCVKLMRSEESSQLKLLTFRVISK
ncbi:unnamed protein product [Trichobilharzia regenti]|nr:unnamed protein product [Trichobilharzia regenti]